MGKIEFDIVKLKQVGNIDVRSAIKNFGSYEEYFSELSKFAKDSKYFLGLYTADMIIVDKKEYAAFLEDIKKNKSILAKLGIMNLLPMLAELEYGAKQSNEESLNNWLSKYNAEIDRVAKIILSAQMITEETPKDIGALEAEKPLILAVDDKPELLTTLVNMLEDRFRIMAATNGKAVLKLIEKHPPELFLLDIEMPQMDGYELADLIRRQEKFEKTPIIFLTSHNTRASVISAVRNGGNDYILKPVTKELLLSKILQQLGCI